MQKIDCQSGFTLVEVLIAVTLLSVAILGAASMQIASTRGNSNAMNLSQRVTFGSDALETIMAFPYKDLKDYYVVGIADLDNTDTVGNLADSRHFINDIDPNVIKLKNQLPANFFDPDDSTELFWNIVENHPVRGTKTVRVILRKAGKEDLQMDFIRTDFTMESN